MTHPGINGEWNLPTLDDVARVAGVSRATVSRVVNGGRLVSQRTCDAVNAAIAELGYRPNRAARALVTRRAGAVAVVVPETDDRVFSDPFFPQAYHGALAAFAGVDMQVLLAMAPPGEGAARMFRYLDSGHVDGAIVISHHGPELARRLLGSAHPVVFVGDPEVPGLPYVELDQKAAAIVATSHLIEQAPDLDGLFVASDLMALGALRALRRAGRRVPEDVLVVGFDNSSAALQASPQLTTMTNPPSELARIAGEMLLGILSGVTPASPVILTSELVVRKSA